MSRGQTAPCQWRGRNGCAVGRSQLQTTNSGSGWYLIRPQSIDTGTVLLHTTVYRIRSNMVLCIAGVSRTRAQNSGLLRHYRCRKGSGGGGFTSRQKSRLEEWGRGLQGQEMVLQEPRWNCSGRIETRGISTDLGTSGMQYVGKGGRRG